MFDGVYPALLTPFDERDQLDLKMFRKNLSAQYVAGVNGVIIGGSLGEASTITTEEKQRMTLAALEMRESNLPVIINIAEGSTRDAITQASLAEKWKADGLMLLPPMRYRTDEKETIEFFKAVARNTSLPIMIYNNPVDYKIEVTPEMFDQLTGIENIIAVKESTRDVTNVTRMLSRFGDRFKILCGVDTLALEELVMGAHGWVAGLVDAFPVETVRLYELVKNGNLPEARELYQWFMPLLELDIQPKLVQYIKLAASRTGLGTEYVRAPRLRLEGEERKKILSIIDAALETRDLIAMNNLTQKN